ncbi:S-adenosyl-L-methionine hydrolase [Serratia phage vB_SmaP-Kaonashi]|nr:S-adenosyl-L-methionine hydrolase [Serratia phage vB_SmaP-Kaonashi]
MLNRMYVMMSAARGQSVSIDERNHNNLCRTLSEDLQYEWDEVQGCYKGVEERSVCVMVHDFREIWLLIKEAVNYSQESILIVDSRNKCFLYFPATNEMNYIGNMFNSKDKPLGVTDYSIINGIYYYVL